jgi:hypothetical protein
MYLASGDPFGVGYTRVEELGGGDRLACEGGRIWGGNQKLSRWGLVLANATRRVVNLGVVDTFGVGYTGVEKLGGKDRPARKGGCIGLTTQNRAAGAQFL